MKISIITVCFNSEATIKDTLESIKRQTYPFVEHIIVDGGSRDNTLAALNGYQHIAKIVSEPDNGIYDAMNKGILLASGDIIGILNSDDIFYSENTLSEIASCFMENPEAKAVYGNLSYFESADKNKVVRFWKTKPYSSGFFEEGSMPPHPSLFVKKAVYNSIGLYKTDYKICADQEFFIRMLKVHALVAVYLDRTIVKMRVGGVSTKGMKSYLITTFESKRAWVDNGLSYPWYLFFFRPFNKVKQLFRKA